MCAEAMRAAKAAVKAAGAHKTRIILQINIDGIKILDEKSNVVFEMKRKHIEQMKQQQEERKVGNESAPPDGVAVADLLDLETEVQQIEQGLQQLEQIPTGTDAFGATPFADPFQDSFAGNAPSMNGSAVSNSLNVSVQNGQPQFQAQFPPQPQNGVWPQQPAMAQQVPQIPMQMPVPPANAPFVAAWGAPQMAHTHSTPAFMPSGFSQTNPFASAVAAPPQASVPVRDPFDTRNILQVPQPMAAPTTVDWGMKENAAPQMQHANSFTTANCFGDNNAQPQQNQMKWEEPRKVTSLEEAFTKLVDMNALVARPANDTKKNPFDHILNPPKASLNALGAMPMRPAPAVMANHADPFGDDFFR
ncbi:hypothetical protein OESDEN_08104 [Oesophagostomum dentatum]|uniref:PID domain-containing protein n=1 Tax=Oesophagostomum dentatum TaxID=61180 RepID=A0A0B1T786_OESDE|nr:hypothetical protein OESDEN_08104 [Oesophagostomum dentatum]